MLKYAHAQIMTKALAPTDASARELRRFAHRHHFDYEVRPGYLYVRSRAISSRCNDNFDEFPAEELEKAYATFKGKPVFVNHHNDDHTRARGVIIDAALHKDANRDGSRDYWVEVLMEVDALRFPKLAAEIINGNIARTSMGCDVAFSVCSACGNKATTPAEYCHHIPASKGMTLYRTTASGHKIGDIIRETCYGLKFFENSLLVEPPADPTALVLGVESGDMSPRRASANGPDRRGGYAVPDGYVLQSELTTPGVPLAGRHLGQQLPLDDPDVGLGQSALGIGGPRHAAASFDHVPGVLPVGPQDPMTGVVTEGNVAGMPNHLAGRYRADQSRVAPSVGPDGAAPGVVQGQASVPVLEGASGPQVAGIRSTAGVDLGQVPRKNAHEGQRTARLTLAELVAEGAAATPPEDHPWFSSTGISHHHIVDHWDASTPEEKKQGARWYPDAHLVAKSIAKLDPRITDDKEAAHKGGGVLSAYSPQQGWWANQHNAARSFHEQRAIGKGEGIMVMASHATAAQKIMDGTPHHEALKGPKTQDFAHLIEHGGYKPQSDEDAEAGKPKEHSDKVVVDRHALSVAAGRRLNADDVKGFPSQSRKHYEVVAGHYRKAAAVISDREGREVPPHEVQAVTWLARQRLNAEGDMSPGQKGRNTVQRNQRKTWQDLSREHTPELHDTDPPNSHVSGLNGDLPEGISFTFHKQYNAPNVHGIEAHVPNPSGGEPTRAGYMQWDPSNGTIGMIETHRDYRRRGIGDALLNRAHEMAQQHGLAAPTRSPLVYPDGKAWNGHARVSPQDYSANPTQIAEPPQPKYQDIREHMANEHRMNLKGLDVSEDGLHKTHEAWHRYNAGGTFHVHGSRKTAFGEQKAPADVDTLREDACPVCGDRDTFDGATCQVCGYVAPPKMFQDPDLEKARQMDLRKDVAEFNDPANPMASGQQVGPDGQPIDPQEKAGGPMDAGDLDENGMPINPDAADPGAQPGSLPGEVQAEVQPGGDPMDPQMLGPDGMPLDPQGIPNELGAPVDPAMLGPDGQPLPQPGQQMMVGPNGEPIGPQALPADAVTKDGQPFTPGPNMPQGPGEPESPEGPEAPLSPDEVGSEGQIPTDEGGDGQIPNPDAGQGVPGTPGDGVPDLQCPACGFTADATNPVSVDMDTSIMPPDGQATPDGVQAGDICPNCGAGQLMSPAEMQGQDPVPVPV